MKKKDRRNRKRAKIADLPAIPNKKYFTIGEASELCGVEPYVLRFWEQEFPMLRPTKRHKRRYYQRKDILLVRQIGQLLYAQGFTIEGARVQLGRKMPVQPSEQEKGVLEETLTDLKQMLSQLGEEAEA